ncbi:hypothetical protein Rsub_13273 [Raphidocelis subcapitata]|uniref:Uncharacterized protein n=1 Tax=Raphidocelis subcapitata TaxID=307507 RepID=A0A2V0PLX9_9CHLO|nr:hypothetical protein Rsub_13273 [Raphidocelis subcapitata]|eukprot:GBG00570.1 hypothetical protein Rsub_13273 [Raphidocelis subcapitata]
MEIAADREPRGRGAVDCPGVFDCVAAPLPGPDPDFVRAAIAEVLAAADLQDAKALAAAEACRTPPDGEPCSDQQQAQPGQPGAGAAAPAGAARLDPSLLELPGNSEATVRLLKARVRSLEEQLQAAIDAGAAKDRDLAEAAREARALQREKAAWAKEQKALAAQAERHCRAAEAAREALAAREAALKEKDREEAKASSSRCGGARPRLRGAPPTLLAHRHGAPACSPAPH